MLPTILVPVDGSELAERALPYASAFARAAGARILLLRALPPPETIPSAGGVPRETQQSATGYLEDLAARQPEPDRVETTTAVGEAADTIVEEIGVRRPDLVVMSTHGRSGIRRWIYGSVADAVMRRAPVPVLLVPAACPGEWPSNRAPRVLLPLDGSELAEGALGLVDTWAKPLHAEVFVLRVVEPRPLAATNPAAYVWLDPMPELEEAHAYVAKVSKKLRDDGYAVRGTDTFGFPVPTIVDTARAESVDFIVMSTHGSGGLTRLLMGSVATGVVQRAVVPILLVGPAVHRNVDSPTEVLAATHAL
jgi:nucleotide-binding universal stress UspA family protein